MEEQTEVPETEVPDPGNLLQDREAVKKLSMAQVRAGGSQAFRREGARGRAAGVGPQ